MKSLILKSGEETFVDDRDFNDVSPFTWYAPKTRGGIAYVTGRCGGRKLNYLHRWILKAKDGQTVDHIDGNPLNNCRSNLRICTQGQNVCNARKHKNCSSKFKGVYFNKRLSKWQSQIKIDKVKCIGIYDNEIEAALAYNVAASFAFGNFARLNLIPAY